MKSNWHDVQVLPSYPEQRLNPVSACNLTPTDLAKQQVIAMTFELLTNDLGWPSGSRQCDLALAKK